MKNGHPSQGFKGTQDLAEKPFDEIIVQCVEDGLEILGSDGKSVVIWLWETRQKLPKKEICSHSVEFSTLLKEIFGTGAIIIESHLVKEIQRIFGLNLDIADLSDAINIAKQNFDTY